MIFAFSILMIKKELLVTSSFKFKHIAICELTKVPLIRFHFRIGIEIPSINFSRRLREAMILYSPRNNAYPGISKV